MSQTLRLMHSHMQRNKLCSFSLNRRFRHGPANTDTPVVKLHRLLFACVCTMCWNLDDRSGMGHPWASACPVEEPTYSLQGVTQGNVDVGGQGTNHSLAVRAQA